MGAATGANGDKDGEINATDSGGGRRTGLWSWRAHGCDAGGKVEWKKNTVDPTAEARQALYL